MAFGLRDLRHELPLIARTEKTGRRQVQYGFLFRFRGSNDTIDVTNSGEFRAWKWITFQSLLHTAIDFRKPLYQKLSDHFAPHIASGDEASHS